MPDDELAFQDKATLCTGGVTPVPVAVSKVVVTCALLVNVKFVLSAPAADGVYLTVKVLLCPAGTVAGTPLSTKWELLDVAPVMVTFVPAAVSVPVAVPLAPRNTLPTAIGDGDRPSVPAVADPVPAKAIVSAGSDPFDVTVTLPLAAAVEVGE